MSSIDKINYNLEMQAAQNMASIEQEAIRQQKADDQADQADRDRS